MFAEVVTASEAAEFYGFPIGDYYVPDGLWVRPIDFFIQDGRASSLLGAPVHVGSGNAIWSVTQRDGGGRVWVLKASFIGEAGGISVTRDEALRLLRWDALHAKDKTALTGWMSLMCKEYGEDDDWCGVYTDDLYEDDGVLTLDEDYQTFEIWVG